MNNIIENLSDTIENIETKLENGYKETRPEEKEELMNNLKSAKAILEQLQAREDYK